MTERAHELEVRINRTICASPHQVYRSWLDPELLRLWLAPGSTEVSRVELDERVGGQFRIWQVHGGQDAGGFECKLLELVPDERIVFQWGFTGPQREAGPTFDSLLTVTMSKSQGDATLLKLVHTDLTELHSAMPGVAKNVEWGWEMTLDKLALAALLVVERT
jgi:uncharacterized protein YndB with AHSA1/START domain